MQLVNKLGLELIEDRNNHIRHYSPSNDLRIEQSINQKFRDNVIPEKILHTIFDENISDKEFVNILLSYRQFKKTQTQIADEFDEVRQRVNDYLVSCQFSQSVSTKNLIKLQKIAIIKQYDVPMDVLLSFFGLSSAEAMPLMKKMGFMDKFSVLRLNQIFKEIYSEIKTGQYIDKGYSPVYYNKKIKGFSIDFKYMVNIDFISDPENMQAVVKQICELDKYVTKQFKNKLNFTYFYQKNQKSETDMKTEDLPSLSKNSFVKPTLVNIDKNEGETLVNVQHCKTNKVDKSTNPDDEPIQAPTTIEIEDEDRNLL